MQQLLNAPDLPVAVAPKAPKNIPTDCVKTFNQLREMLNEMDIPYYVNSEDTLRRYAIKMTPQPGVIPTPYSAYDLMLADKFTEVKKQQDFTKIRTIAIKSMIILGAIITSASIIKLFS